MFSIDFRRETLSNGLTVILAPDRSIPVVALNLWYGVGSRNEGTGKTGFAHLFEHMMFQGSANVPKGRHFELVERAGGSLNATTWFDRTNYFETVPSHQLDLVLWLESDRMGWFLPSVHEEKLANQRDVVQNERKQRYDNQPYGDWDERIQSMVFPPEHPYHHTVIGSMEDIRGATLDDVKDFFRTYYRPNNAILTLAGDFESGDALERVERYFGEIPAGAEIPPVPGRIELDPVIGRTVRQDIRTEVPLPRVCLAARIPPFTNPEFYVADVATSILSAGRSSRLYRQLVRKKKIAKDVVGFAFPIVTGASFLVTWATGFPGADPLEIEAALVSEVEGLSDVTEAEVERSVAMSETALLRQIEGVASRADLLSMYQMHFGEAGRLNSEVDRLRSVKANQVRAFARRFLGAENRALLTYIPNEKS